MTIVNWELFPAPKKDKMQEHLSNADNEGDTDCLTFQSGAANFHKISAGPYEWRTQHNAWLQAVMRTTMNDTTVPGIPTIKHVDHIAQQDPPACPSPAPPVPTW